jgi:general secretion pathway protein E
VKSCHLAANAFAMELFEPIELLDSDDQAPIISLINALCAQAILQGASDISVFLIDSLINKMLLVSFFAVDVVVPEFSVTLTNLSFSAV